MSLLVMFSNAMRQKQMITRAIACGMLLTLSSCCWIPPLPHAQPGPPLPPDFNGKSSPESSAQLTVEEFYQDPVLVCLISQALVGNQRLRIMEQDIQSASTVILGRRGAYLPFVRFRGEAGLDKHSLYTPLGAAEEQLTYPGEHHFPDPLPNFLAAADISWRIDIWRELRNSRDAAVQRYVAAIERRNYFVTELVAEIAENYFELMMLDQRILILEQTIELQEESLEFAEATLAAGRGTLLPVRRFQAEIRSNRSELLIVRQQIIQTENRINFLLGRYPQPVERDSANFLDRNLRALSVGLPAQLLLYRTDIREAERELAATGLDVLVARAHFLPRLEIDGTVGFEAFSPRYLFYPEALVADVAGQVVAPVINRAAIKADYFNANAEQLQAVYNYQRVILNAFTEVVNSLAAAENYGQSVTIKRQQLTALRASVDVATSLFQSNLVDYLNVLFAQRDLLIARTALVETKLRQLSAIVSAYQALGGGVVLSNSAQYHPGKLYCPPVKPRLEKAPAPAPLEEAPAPEPQPDDAMPPQAQPGGAAPAEPQPEDAAPPEAPLRDGSFPVYRPVPQSEEVSPSEAQLKEIPPSEAQLEEVPPSEPQPAKAQPSELQPEEDASPSETQPAEVQPSEPQLEEDSPPPSPLLSFKAAGR